MYRISSQLRWPVKKHRLIMNTYACHELHWIVVAAVQSRDFLATSTVPYIALVRYFLPLSVQLLLDCLVNQLFSVWAFDLKWLFLWLYWTSFMVGMLSFTWCEVCRWAESRAPYVTEYIYVNLQDEWCQKWASENIIIDLCNASCVHFLRIFDAYRCLFKWVVCWAMWMVKTSWFQCTPSIAFSAA